MKRFILLACFLAILFTSIAQVVNLNPDPNGEPCIAGPQPEITPEMLSAMTEYEMSDEAMSALLPLSWNNSQLPIDFFPPIILQTYNSCAQAAGVAYTFTYEINRHRGISASSDDNKYHQGFTYNFLNWGLNIGTFTII